MALPHDVEEILSDDYEEGEIFEEDNLYEDVSSLEEFSFEEGEIKVGDEIVDLTKNDVKASRVHRKKEHKCKEDSVCRKERKGKHCYARIRKDKTTISTKLKDEVVEQSLPEKSISRKVDVTSSKRNVDKLRASSPPGRLRMDYVKPHRHDYKDYHEKENRISNRRHWSSNEKNSRNRCKYPEKPLSWNRTSKEYKSKHISNSAVSSTYRTQLECKVDSSKTSLLKRLVGSGTSGVKTLRENENLVTSTVIPSSDVLNLQENIKPPTSDVNICSQTCTPGDKKTEGGGHNTEKIEDSEKSPLDQQIAKENTTPEPPEPKKKGFGLVWKRSIKDDKDELHLRVEALKSAWVKKFSERKKKGLINQKKSNNVDDSLVDFVLGSDDDDEEEIKVAENVKVDSSVKFNVTDLTGDILKPVDMIIVSTNENIQDKPIICELIGTPTAKDSSVFIPSTVIQDNETKACPTQKLVTSSIPMPAENSNHVQENNHLNESLKSSAKSSMTPKSVKTFSNKSTSRSKKRRGRRPKKKVVKSEFRKSLSNSKELDEERILRENALMSLKKYAPSASSHDDQSKGTNSSSKVAGSCDNNLMIPQQSYPSSSENKPFDKKLLNVCEYEGTGAISSDNLDDEIDEDILRAQLLSSLTKQVTNNGPKQNVIRYNTNLKPLSIKKTALKKQDKRRVKHIIKRVWKSSAVNPKINKIENEIKSKINLLQYTNINNLKETRPQGQTGANSQSHNMPPIPQVPKMIISVGDSDSSDEDEIGNNQVENICEPNILPSVPADIEANIDLLLQEAKKNTQFGKLAVESANLVESCSVESCRPVTNVEEKQIEKYTSIVNPTVTIIQQSNQATPQALKHLPAWQQEEYRRLKKKIAEKERVLQEVSRAKVTEVEERLGGKCNQLDETSREKGYNYEDDCLEKKTIEEDNPLPGKEELVSLSSIKTKESSNETRNESQNPQLSTNYSSDDSNSLDSKSFPNIASCSVLEDISVMNDIVNEFDKNSSEYTEFVNKWNRLKRLIKLTEARMLGREKKLLEMKDNIQKKDRNISSRIDSLMITQKPSAEKNKPMSRDMELIKLKYKEVSLRAQFLFHTFSTQKPDGKVKVQTTKENRLEVVSGVKRIADYTPDSPTHGKKPLFENSLTEKGKDVSDLPNKRSFSGKEKEFKDWDPNTPVCHFDLNGICKDQECKYQHLKTV